MGKDKLPSRLAWKAARRNETWRQERKDQKKDVEALEKLPEGHKDRDVLIRRIKGRVSQGPLKPVRGRIDTE